MDSAKPNATLFISSQREFRPASKSGAFDDAEALAWLHSQLDGQVIASAAELGRQWGWNRMRAGRRLKAWEEAGLIRRNAEAIIVTASVTPTITDVTPTVTEAVSVTVTPVTTGAGRSMTRVKVAALIVALALACVSAAFSIDGLMAIFAGAFWPIITMGAAPEAGKLVAAAWPTEHWNSAPSLLRLVLIAMIGVLMSLNAVGVFGFLTRAPLGAMTIADQKRRDRADMLLSASGKGRRSPACRSRKPRLKPSAGALRPMSARRDISPT